MEVADAVPVAGQGDPGLSHALGLQGEKQRISKLRTPTFRERQADAIQMPYFISLASPLPFLTAEKCA